MKILLVILGLGYLSVAVANEAYTYHIKNNTPYRLEVMFTRKCGDQEKTEPGFEMAGNKLDVGFSPDWDEKENCKLLSIDVNKVVEKANWQAPYKGFVGNGTWTVVEKNDELVIEKTE